MTGLIGVIAEVFLKIALILGIYKSGVDHEKKNNAEALAKSNEEQARKWANRPVDRDDTVIRLRELADRKPSNNP